MAHKYFTEKLIGQNKLDLADVFADKVRSLQQVMSIDFGLLEIVMFIKQRSQDFKSSDNYLKELDYAVKSIVDTYYKSIREPNPFVSEEDTEVKEKYQKGVKPRDAVTVDAEGKIVKKPSTEPAPSKKSQKVEEPEEFNETQIREAIDALQILAEMGDEQAQEAIDALELLLP